MDPTLEVESCSLGIFPNLKSTKPHCRSDLNTFTARSPDTTDRQPNQTTRLEVKAPKTHVAGRDPLLDMAVTGHIVHGNEMKSAEFKRFLAQFPEWSYPVGWTASYKNFKF